MPEGPGCIVDAGIIDEKCVLTPTAKKKFIQAVKDELMFGTLGLPVPLLFPCGPPVPANPQAYLLDLENEKKFPEFHKNILGAYQKVACVLNLKSDFKFLPICCPVSLGFKLGIDIDIPNFPGDFIKFAIPNLPALALKLDIMPPFKIALKFPDLPAIPPPLPKFDIPPKIKIPDFDALFNFNIALAIGIPKLLLNLALKAPQLALKLPDLPGLFSFVCDIAFDANIFGTIDPSSTVMIVAAKVLITKTVEMLLIAAIGTTLGSSPGGITGGLGSYLGYKERSRSNKAGGTPREKITSYASSCVGLSFGDAGKCDEYAQRLLPVEYQDAATSNSSDPRAIGKQATLNILKRESSSGMLARACLAAGGASYVFDSKIDTSRLGSSQTLYYDFFNDKHHSNQEIAGIAAVAIAKDAVITKQRSDLPSLKKGDVIVLKSSSGNHALVLLEDYERGSFKLTTAEGGQRDANNAESPTSVARVEYAANASGDKRSFSVDASGNVLLAACDVVVLIDGEKLCTNTTGTNMSKSNGKIPPGYSDGPGFTA